MREGEREKRKEKERKRKIRVTELFIYLFIYLFKKLGFNSFLVGDWESCFENVSIYMEKSEMKAYKGFLSLFLSLFFFSPFSSLILFSFLIFFFSLSSPSLPLSLSLSLLSPFSFFSPIEK